MEDQLTSRTLALARLVYLCVSDASLGRLARHRLTAALLPLASGSAAGADMAVEPPFGALLQTLVSAGVPQSWVGEYARQLRERATRDSHGFELATWPSDVSDFGLTDEVETVYELWKEAAAATDFVRRALLPSSNRRFRATDTLTR